MALGRRPSWFRVCWQRERWKGPQLSSRTLRDGQKGAAVGVLVLGRLQVSPRRFAVPG
jgi:hypothetical protein